MVCHDSRAVRNDPVSGNVWKDCWEKALLASTTCAIDELISFLCTLALSRLVAQRQICFLHWFQEKHNVTHVPVITLDKQWQWSSGSFLLAGVCIVSSLAFVIQSSFQYDVPEYKNGRGWSGWVWCLACYESWLHVRMIALISIGCFVCLGKRLVSCSHSQHTVVFQFFFLATLAAQIVRVINGSAQLCVRGRITCNHHSAQAWRCLDCGPHSTAEWW